MSDQIRDLLISGLRYEHVQHTDCRGACAHVTELMCTANHLSEQLAGWRPPAQVITEPAEFDALPEKTAVVIGDYAFQKFGGWWHGSGGVMPMHSEQLIDMHEGEAATVVWSPTERAGTE